MTCLLIIGTLITGTCIVFSFQVQRALFSATIPPQVEELAFSCLRSPLKILIGAPNASASTIEQKLVFVGR